MVAIVDPAAEPATTLTLIALFVESVTLTIDPLACQPAMPTRPARLDTFTVVEAANDPAICNAPELSKWNPALLAQFVSEGRTATIPARLDTVVTVPMFQVPACAAETG